MATPKIPTEAEFVERRRRLLPPGQAWIWPVVGDKLLLGFSNEQIIFRKVLNRFLLDILPQSTVFLLKEWLLSVSLPDECTTASLTNRDLLLALLRANGAESVEQYEAIFPDCTVVEKFVARVDIAEIDFELVEDEDWAHTWILETPEEIAGLDFAIVDEFEVDEAIEAFTNNFQCNALKEFPAHQKVFIVIV